MKVVDYNCRENGFRGQLYDPENNNSKAVLVFMGGESGMIPTAYLAETFALQGYVSLAYIYFGAEGLQPTPTGIDLNRIKLAIDTLKQYNDGQIEKIAVYGISMGGTIALETAAVFSEDISCAIGVSLSHSLLTGFLEKKNQYDKNSYFILNGEQLPRLNVRSVKNLYYDLMRAYENDNDDSHYIPIEKIKGPVLVIAGEYDTAWPSAYSVCKIEERIKEKQFPYAYKAIVYPKASHFMGVLPDAKKHKQMHLVHLLGMTEILHPILCSRARKESSKLVFEWLENKW